jgi:hypothetical protein
MTDQRDDPNNTIVPDWELIHRQEAEGSKRALCLYQRDGQFRYVIERWLGPWVDDGGTALDQGYWAQETASGYYFSRRDAEADADRVMASLKVA